MNTFDLLNAIGDVDDILVAKAKQNKKSNHTVYATLGALAACFLLFFMVPVIFITMHGASLSAPESMGTENTTLGHEIVRIEIITEHGTRIVEEDNVICMIHTAVMTIIEDEAKDLIGSSCDSINAESVTMQSGTKDADGIYRLNFRRHEGVILKYDIYDNTLKDLSTGKEYRLTKNETEYILSLLNSIGDKE